LAGINATFSENDMLLNHGMHGQQDLANTLLRAGKPFGVVTGHWEDPAALAEIEDWAVAASAATRLRRAEIGRIGWAFQDMGDFGLDETDFLMKIGPHVRQVPLDLLADGQQAAPADEVAAIVDDYKAKYQVSADLSESELEASARAEWSVRRAVRELGLDGISVHYEVLGQDPRFVALPFAAAARLLAEGVSFGGEGDVTSAAAVLMLHYLCKLATFSEMFTMDFGGGTVFMSHFAEGNPVMAKQGQPVQMMRREGWVGSGGVSASLAFTFEPGPVTMTNLTVGAGGEFHLILTQGEAQDFLVEGQPTPHFRFQPHKSGQTLFSQQQCLKPDQQRGENSVCPDLCHFLGRYLELGGSHHVALAPGDQTSRVTKCAKLLGLRVDVI
jgi:L-arabinose isomerase